MHSTSATLLLRLKDGGDEADWRRFMNLYTPLLYYWATRNGLQAADAADLVQDVLVLLVKKLPEFTYDEQGSFRGWLRTVTLNRLRDLQRRRGETTLEDGEWPIDQAAEEDTRDAFWEVEYRQHLVARALEVMRDSFEPTTWKACWEMVVKGKKAAQVGAELGISEGAVYVAKSRVVKRLRKELEGLWD
ncbi:MAG: sigma-70 family RNA polymerase sigma factor [Planctomycetota bacterium]|nr:sigma-70 family RNA polymerase sigma factor [Planctomycetota bacterium]